MAGALVGGAFLSAALQVLFDRLANPELLNLFRQRKHDGRLLRKLKFTLLGLNAVLDDAENKQITNQPVKDWLDDLKDAIYHADDILDEIATEALRCKSEAEYESSPNQVRHPTSTPNRLFDEIESKIEEIIDRLESFAKEKDLLGLVEVVGRNWPERLPTTSLVDESDVYGRDNDQEEIVKLLLSDEASGNKIDVIPIVGMGGVGKTTLAQLVYNDDRTKNHFDMKAWVCVSEEFDVFRVVKTIIEAVTWSTCGTEDLNLLQVNLKQSLTGKKFLIVLDDVWNDNSSHWDILRAPFTAGAYGSKIIVTTRNHSVASMMQTIPVHQLQLLSDEDCWLLFAKNAFDKGDYRAHPNIEKIGKEIVKKCKGLPLAVKTLAGLLRSNLDEEEWDNILKSEIWELPEDKNNVLPALRLSYQYLPSHLKQCFAYCSIFPKDYQFEREKLVLLWIAQSFVQPKSKKPLEKTGDEYFHELLSKSFFQKSSGDNSSFVMHDLLHDLAQIVSGQFSFRLDDMGLHDISIKVRHFSYLRGKCDGFEKFRALNEVKCLRSFLPLKPLYNDKNDPLYISKKVWDDILPTQQCLRVLSFPHYEIVEVPNSIGNLIHLRYLDLSYTKIKQLPEIVCTLYNLQTLLLSNCQFLTTLPVELGKLTCLRHLDIGGTNLTEMPIQMSRLKDLQHLTAFVVGKCSGFGINELKELRHLRGKLSISSLQNVRSGRDASEAKLKEKEHIEELVLEWGSATNDSKDEREVLDNLQPHTYVKRLTINNYGGTRFPDWLGDHSFSHMVYLRLENCQYCLSLPPLGQLPSLKQLDIVRMNGITMVGQEFYGDGSLGKPFQSLETLRFEKMSEWVQWCFLGAGEFSRLRELRLIDCPKLVGILPKHIPSWVRLEIQECPELMASLQRTSAAAAAAAADAAGELVFNECHGTELGWQGLSSLVELEVSEVVYQLRLELSTLTNLEKLSILGCPRNLSFTADGLPPALKELHIFGFPKLVFPLSEEMETASCYSSLEILWLQNFILGGSLNSLPIGFFPKLQELTIAGCTNLESLSIPNEHAWLQNLKSVCIRFCPNMESFPQGGLPAPNLTELRIDTCKKLKSLPERMNTLLPSLRCLFINDCPEIESFPRGGLPSSLVFLDIWNCKKLVACRKEWDIQKTLSSLVHFDISGEYEEGVLESFPDEGLLPSALPFLNIKDIPNLKSLNNKGLQLLGSLKALSIGNCPQLQALPEEGLPASLSRLTISNCPLLKHRCQREEGDDWHKIARIPFIKIDDEVISE